MVSNASYLHSSEEAALPRINRRFLLKETRTLAAKPGTRYSNAYFCASQVTTNGLTQGNSRQASTDKLRSDRTMKAALIAATPTAELHNCHQIRRVSTFASEFDTKNRKVSGVFFAYFNVHAR